MQQFTYREFSKLLKNNGYIESRQKGSHVIYTSNNGNHISVPLHIRSVIARRLIKEHGLSI